MMVVSVVGTKWHRWAWPAISVPTRPPPCCAPPWLLVVPAYLANPQLADGSLLRVLPDWTPPDAA